MSIFLRAAQYLPTVKEPEKEQSLKQMLTWTGIVLLLYFFLVSIDVYGGDSAAVEQALQQLGEIQTVMGAEIGSIVTLGIAPIVTSSIVLQMMVGSDILKWDTNSQEGRRKFQSTQKLLAYTLALVQAFGFVLAGTFGDVSGNPALAGLLIGQIALGGWIIIVLDDLVQKWGFGSGVGLFIAAGVSQAVYMSMLSPLTQTGQLYWLVDGNPEGMLISFFTTLEFIQLMPLISTLIVFAVVVYLQAMKVEIPLTFGNVRGFGQKWPLKFLYTSVMPVILIVAALANINIMATLLAGDEGCSILGCFDANNQPESGLIYYLTPPVEFFELLLVSGPAAVVGDIPHVLFYTSVYVFGSIIFSIFWMKTTGQDSAAVAEQIQQTGMKVPGFRKDKRVIQKVLDRYIPGLTVLSGAVVGFLAAAADMTRAAGGGIGILLTVMILYRLYEQLAQKHMEELHPAMKEFFQ